MKKKKQIAIIVPAHNEEDNIKTTNKEEITFNDSASESGSEMDFDISEFQNSLDE